MGFLVEYLCHVRYGALNLKKIGPTDGSAYFKHYYIVSQSVYFSILEMLELHATKHFQMSIPISSCVGTYVNFSNVRTLAHLL